MLVLQSCYQYLGKLQLLKTALFLFSEAFRAGPGRTLDALLDNYAFWFPVPNAITQFDYWSNSPDLTLSYFWQFLKIKSTFKKTNLCFSSGMQKKVFFSSGVPEIPKLFWARKISVSTSQVTTANMRVLISLFEDLSCHFRIRVHTYSFCADCHQVWFAQNSWPESRNLNFEYQTSYDICISGSLCKSIGKPEQPTRVFHQLATLQEAHVVK